MFYMEVRFHFLINQETSHSFKSFEKAEFHEIVLIFCDNKIKLVLQKSLFERLMKNK